MDWHETIGSPTIADAIVDRMVHQAYQIDIKGETKRKPQGALDSGGQKSEGKT